MHEIRATVPFDCVAEAVRLAHAIGIRRVAVSEVFVHGPEESPDLPLRQLSVETSTPKARAFVEAFLSSPILSRADCTLTSREVRAIVNRESVADLTRPTREPFPDIIQDLWQLSHVTPSYIARAAAGAVLLATGVIDNSPVAIVVAALFLPFLSQLLAVSFGIWSRDRRLVLQGILTVVISAALAIAAGAAVAWMEGGPIRFGDFKSPINSFAISAIIGITAGLSSGDDTGRRYLIGVAAVQLAIIPVWLGASLVLDMPSHAILYSRLLSFAINLVTISISSPGCLCHP